MNVFMTLVSDKWWIESFRSYVDYQHNTEFFIGGLNALANMFYKLAVLIWQMFDTLLAFLGDTSGIKALSIFFIDFFVYIGYCCFFYVCICIKK